MAARNRREGPTPTAVDPDHAHPRTSPLENGQGRTRAPKRKISRGHVRGTLPRKAVAGRQAPLRLVAKENDADVDSLLRTQVADHHHHPVLIVEITTKRKRESKAAMSLKAPS